MIEQLDTILRWGKVREVSTKRGPRMVRSAVPTEEFWMLWAKEQSSLRNEGVSVGRDYEDPDKWRVTHWAELPASVVAERSERVAMSSATSAAVAIPAPAGCVYMPFQLAGARYALNVFREPDAGCLIGDEPGLGKTMQAIAVINATPSIHRVVIICPLTLKGNWERELVKWLTRPLTIGQATADYYPRTDIVLIHYNILHRYTHRLSSYHDLLVVDECHRLGNRGTRQTRCVVGHKPSRKESERGAVVTSGIPAKRKLFLSGTPFENRPSQLWPIISYLAPGLFSSRSAFEKRYCGAHQGSHGWESDGATNLPELAQRLRGSFMVRRLKRDVLKELPPKTRTVVEVPSDGLANVVRDEQRAWAHFEGELERAQVAIELAKAGDSEEAFKTSVAQMRQATSLVFTEISRVRHDTAVAKLPAMIEMLREEMEQTHKIIIAAHHRDVIAGSLAAFPGVSVSLTGETPQAERDAAVARFQNDPECRLFFASIRAAGEGITLTAASTVIFFENDWTASKMGQMSDRAHRIGQRDNVRVLYYVLPGTIDAHMISTWIRKEEILEQALDTEREMLAEEQALVPRAEPLATRQQLEVAATAITSAMREAIHEALRLVARSCDGAHQRDGHGFSKVDVKIGKSLAEQPYLTPRQAALGQKLCKRYGRQIGETALAKCG